MRQKDEPLRAEVLVRGRVQGVFFRAETTRMARALGLCGYVRNRPDGGVDAVFEGPARQVRRAVSWCYQGPPAARVEHVQVRWGKPTGQHTGFTVRW